MTILHNFAVFLYREETRDCSALAALDGDEQPESKQQQTIKLTLLSDFIRISPAMSLRKCLPFGLAKRRFQIQEFFFFA